MIGFIKGFIDFFTSYFWILNTAFIFSVILVEKKNPVYTFFWIFLIALVPYLGFILYLMFGLSFRKKRKANRVYDLKSLKSHSIDYTAIQDYKTIITYIEMSSKNHITKNNDIQFFYEGIDFFDELKKDLKNAKKLILMEYYIFRYDKLGIEILEILADKANSGVEVILMVDAMHTPPKKMVKFCRDNNINLNIFFKSRLSFFNIRANYRNHKKVTIIDSDIAYIGGMNIGSEYIGQGSLGYWKDLSAKILGESVIELKKEFYHSYAINDKEFNYEYIELIEKEKKDIYTEGICYSQIISSGPNYEFKTSRDAFLQLIKDAKKSIIIQTPYFVPDDSLIDALKIAVLTGVDVKIMIPDIHDHFVVGHVTDYYLKDFVEIGAKVYRYTKGFLHSKVIIIDKKICSFGTINFDYRSFYLNFEINMNVYNEDISKQLVNNFNNDLKNCIDYDISKIPTSRKLLQSVLRLLAPIL